MKYIGWPTDVNSIILDSTTVSIGEGATIEETLQSGGKKRTRLASTAIPDRFSVTMDFDFIKRDANGLTEKDRFLNWLKYKHKYGANPFEFKSILIGSREQKSNEVMTYYKISPGVSMQKSGFCMRTTMTWEEDIVGSIVIEDVVPVVDYDNCVLQRVNNEHRIVIVYTEHPDIVPTTQTFTVQKVYNGVTETVNYIPECLNDKKYALWFPTPTEVGEHIIYLDSKQIGIIEVVAK